MLLHCHRCVVITWSRTGHVQCGPREPIRRTKLHTTIGTCIDVSFCVWRCVLLYRSAVSYLQGSHWPSSVALPNLGCDRRSSRDVTTTSLCRAPSTGVPILRHQTTCVQLTLGHLGGGLAQDGQATPCPQGTAMHASRGEGRKPPPKSKAKGT